MGTFTPIVLFWYIFPAIVLVGCNFLVKLFSLDRRFKIKAPDLAVPFLWGGMHALSRNMATFSFLPFFMISMLLMAICIAVFQAYYYDEIIYSRYLKMTWRLAFLLTIVFYGLLIVLNILTYL
ncbi:DUF3397 domain-containing protein [Enterococcus durans]|uniref:DUF3397 domain-containing protein n=2 Tax=Enterococcus durans TaxID=53345 RepID=A0A377L1M0_9ENTE|nr:DUF3397 domain-containing protein [Enterococcus durans]HCB26888.1 DUF3397 domain-containing protein [Enterococcus sp.]EOT33966.1 lipoprotein [Enterococcus durans ATCC 6056]EOU26083.1 lipoprotein [Enterococcus durans ATCC 6056]MCD5010842.1 DUF3397 domain-containing protein [Enterococcus durans]MDB1683692.1 DUF3397 domain-containing protein [Enterococcus durans]